MKPETLVYLRAARQCLGDAGKLADLNLFRIAVREAYLAAFHAAQAAIFEDLGKVAKTHWGVRTEFARLADGYGAKESGATKFLADAYQWKEAADYDPATAATQFDRLRAVGAIGSRSSAEAQRRYADAVNNLTLVASPEVLKDLYRFTDETSYRNASRSASRHDEILTALLNAMRADLGPGRPAERAHIAFRMIDVPPDSTASSR